MTHDNGHGSQTSTHSTCADSFQYFLTQIEITKSVHSHYYATGILQFCVQPEKSIF